MTATNIDYKELFRDMTTVEYEVALLRPNRSGVEKSTHRFDRPHLAAIAALREAPDHSWAIVSHFEREEDGSPRVLHSHGVWKKADGKFTRVADSYPPYHFPLND